MTTGSKRLSGEATWRLQGTNEGSGQSWGTKLKNTGSDDATFAPFEVAATSVDESALI